MYWQPKTAEEARAVFVVTALVAPIFLAAAVLALRTGGFTRIAALAVAVAFGAFSYARFVEPRLLLAPEYAIALKTCYAAAGTARLAVFSDAHLGPFGNTMPMGRVAAKLRAIRPDAVLFAGDWTFNSDDPGDRLRPLSAARAPIYSVYGNHDVGGANPPVAPSLSRALQEAGVTSVDNRVVRLEAKGGRIEIAGFTDFRRGREDGHLRTAHDLPRVLVTHYPGWIRELAADDSFDLMVAGHTHGGQIYLPGVTCWLLRRACEGVRYGYAEIGGRSLFVTSGTGMSVAPLRFLAPPRVDVLTLTWSSCAERGAEPSKARAARVKSDPRRGEGA